MMIIGLTPFPFHIRTLAGLMFLSILLAWPAVTRSQERSPPPPVLLPPLQPPIIQRPLLNSSLPLINIAPVKMQQPSLTQLRRTTSSTSLSQRRISAPLQLYLVVGLSKDTKVLFLQRQAAAHLAELRRLNWQISFKALNTLLTWRGNSPA